MAGEKCPVCRKSMPPEDLVMPSRCAVSAYYKKNDGSGEVAGDCPGDPSTMVCGRDCLVRLLEFRAKQVPKRQNVRVLVALNTTEAPEVLASFARQLRSIKE